MTVVFLLLSCKHDDPPAPDRVTPLGIPLLEDGVTYAGASVIDLTPEILETFTDLDGDFSFGGCLDDPGCAEPFDDVDGDSWFDAVWIGGFGPMRPANGVHDPITARTLVLSRDGEYAAFVTLDLVGLGHPRIWQARDALGVDGFEPHRLVVSTSHNHQGPDTMGLWGDPLAGVPGFDPDYQQRVAEAIEQGVRDAAGAMVAVDLTIGRTSMRDRGPWFNGPVFGGKNPDEYFHGMIHDGRDPIVVSDQLLVLQGRSGSDTVFTLTNWSGHPETRGSGNNDLSADWVGAARQVIEATYGGIALHLPESLGGMQSALSGELPLVLDDGTHVFQVCDAAAVADPYDADCFGQPIDSPRVDADGDEVPVWAETDSWAFVTSHGWHIAEAAIDALAVGEAVDGPLRIDRETFYLPVTNIAYNLLGPMGLFDIGLDSIVVDDRCPELDLPDIQGCFESHVFRFELGSLGLLTVPGELLPELAWGLPNDAAWLAEVGDPEARGVGATYFRQHDADCYGVVEDYEDCRDTLAIDACDCLSLHAWPYRLTDEPGLGPMLDHLDTPYKAMVGMTDSYFSYIIPEPDINHEVSLFSDDGDHYEDTVSASFVFGDRVLRAHTALDDRF